MAPGSPHPTHSTPNLRLMIIDTAPYYIASDQLTSLVLNIVADQILSPISHIEERLEMGFLSRIGQWILKKYSDSIRKVKCANCRSGVELYWDTNYNGYRGKCTHCGTNWAES